MCGGFFGCPEASPYAQALQFTDIRNAGAASRCDVSAAAVPPILPPPSARIALLKKRRTAHSFVGALP